MTGACSAWLSRVRLRASRARRPGLALVELSVVEQRYRAVLQVLAGVPVTEVAAGFGARCHPSAMIAVAYDFAEITH